MVYGKKDSLLRKILITRLRCNKMSCHNITKDYSLDLNKVCMITTNHSPLDSRIFYKEAKSLKKAGYDVTVIGHTNSKVKEVVDGIQIVGIEEKNELKTYLPLLIRLLKEALSVDAEIYHCHEPDSFLVAMYLKIFKHKRITYDVHEYYRDIIPFSSLQKRIFLIFMLSFIEPLFCRYADAIITADAGISKIYQKFNKKVYSLFNFPSFEVFKPSNNQDIKERDKNHFVIIYIGGMSERRGIFELIRAVHKVSKTYPLIKLLLLGNFGTKDFEEKCIEYVRSNDLSKNVEFLGFVPHNEVPKYISAADIGAILFHSIPLFTKAAYPIKLFEYMICEKSVIASNLPTLEKVINGANCGIAVDPTNPEKIADAIIYLLEHPEEAKRMGENGRRAVEEKYNWNEMEKRLLKIYKEILP